MSTTPSVAPPLPVDGYDISEVLIRSVNIPTYTAVSSLYNGLSTTCTWADLPNEMVRRDLEFSDDLMLTFGARYLRYLQPVSNEILMSVWHDVAVDISLRFTTISLMKLNSITTKTTENCGTVRFSIAGGWLAKKKCNPCGYLELGIRRIGGHNQVWIAWVDVAPDFWRLVLQTKCCTE